METTSTSTPETVPSTGLRSTFLTVLCILTFIGSGSGVISAIQSYVTADAASAKVSERLEKEEDKVDQPGVPNFIKQIFSSAMSVNADIIRKTSIFKFISCLLTLIGAIMMWQLKKNGFYLYIAGILILVTGPIVVMGVGTLSLIGAAGSAIVGIAFIAMYSANLKYMIK